MGGKEESPRVNIVGLELFFKIYLFIFVCMCVSLWEYEYNVCGGEGRGSRKQAWDVLELDLCEPPYGCWDSDHVSGFSQAPT